jgi:hypothetical protein
LQQAAEATLIWKKIKKLLAYQAFFLIFTSSHLQQQMQTFSKRFSILL